MILDMKQLSLLQALNIDNNTVASFYGAGGKTSLLLKLASEMIESGGKVLITTTTKMYAPEGFPLFSLEKTQDIFSTLNEHYKEHSSAVLFNYKMSDGKLCGIDPDLVEQLQERLDIAILVEADGSKGRPLKGYRNNEPVIPSSSSLIIPVIGADAVNAVLDEEHVHCIEEFIKSIPAAKYKNIVTVEIVAAAFIKMAKLGLCQAADPRLVFILNKADLLNDFSHTALQLLSFLQKDILVKGMLLLTEASNAYPVQGYFMNDFSAADPGVSCVVLAAGESRRMGSNKLMLDINGVSMLESTLQNICDAGIEDIIVVVQPGSSWSRLLKKNKYKIVENHNYKSGMAESVKVGLNSVEKSSQGVIFALADQPLIPSKTYRELIYYYSKNFDLITCPLYRGQRGNPVLFDRRTWPLMQQLSGDRGGRVLLETLPDSKIGYFESDNEAVLLDIDTPGDYATLNK